MFKFKIIMQTIFEKQLFYVLHNERRYHLQLIIKSYFRYSFMYLSQPTFNCSKSQVETVAKDRDIETSERYQWRHSGVFIVNFEHISRIVLVHPLCNLDK